MLTEMQATAVAEYLLANTPSSSGELDHSYISAWQMSCEALEALGYAAETARGARLLPAPALPAVLPRWDDTCCIVLSAADQAGLIRLKHPRSETTDETGPASADPETATILNLLRLTASGAWTEAAAAVLWRTAPDEVRPVPEGAFAAQVELAVTHMPDTIRDRIRVIYAEHDKPVVRAYLTDWIFYEAWRWGDGWLTNECGGKPLGIFHDPLAQRARAAVLHPAQTGIFGPAMPNTQS